MDNHQDESRQILLSREELLFVLQQLDATTIPGLESDPLGDLTPEGQTLALTVAERALRARGLVQLASTAADLAVRPVRVDQQLLTMIGVCAYSQRAIFLYHRGREAGSSGRYFGHIRSDNTAGEQGDIVIGHTLPAPDLHRLTRFPSRTDLFADLLTSCACAEVRSGAHEFTLPFSVFQRVQETTDTSERETAQQFLLESNVSEASAAAFVELFAEDYQLSILQMVQQQADNTVTQREFLLFHAKDTTWLAFANGQSAGETEMLIRTTDHTELQQLWSAWL